MTKLEYMTIIIEISFKINAYLQSKESGVSLKIDGIYFPGDYKASKKNNFNQLLSFVKELFVSLIL